MHVVSAHVLGKHEPQPVLLAVCSMGKSSKMGETSAGIMSVPHLDRLFDPVPGARTGVISMSWAGAIACRLFHQLSVVKVLPNAIVL